MRAVYIPERLERLWEVISDHPHGALLAGGTDLLVKVRKGLLDPPCLIGLERLKPLREIRVSDVGIFIGACTPFATLLDHPVIRDGFPVLSKAISVLGSPAVRNMGTIGGNLITASPAGDTLPPLYVLDAEVEIRRKDGARRMSVSQFIRGPGKTALLPGEIVSGVWLKRERAIQIQHYEKVGLRKSQSIAIVSFAALLKFNRDRNVEQARLAWGSVGPTVVTSKEAEAALVGKPLRTETLEAAAALARRAASPMDDIRASAGYRRTVAGNLILRLLSYSSEADLFSKAQLERK